MFIKRGQLTCESPKIIYFPCDYTFRQLKQHLISSFKFLNGKPEGELRLWRLAAPFSEFMFYYRQQLNSNVSRSGVTLIVKPPRDIMFRGYSLERAVDMHIADYGLKDTDVLFIEIWRPDGWTFVLDASDSKFFDVSAPLRKPMFSVETSYRRFWENAFSRSFDLAESTTSGYPMPEYDRILRLLAELEGRPKDSAKKENVAPCETVRRDWASVVRRRARVRGGA